MFGYQSVKAEILPFISLRYSWQIKEKVFAPKSIVFMQQFYMPIFSLFVQNLICFFATFVTSQEQKACNLTVST